MKIPQMWDSFVELDNQSLYLRRLWNNNNIVIITIIIIVIVAQEIIKVWDLQSQGKA